MCRASLPTYLYLYTHTLSPSSSVAHRSVAALSVGSGADTRNTYNERARRVTLCYVSGGVYLDVGFFAIQGEKERVFWVAEATKVATSLCKGIRSLCARLL